jgi:RimJ/RimL family protein N-acetyltransferase
MEMEFDPQPRLHGEQLMLRPLQAGDRDALWEVARDPLVWEQHPDKTRFQPEGFARFFQNSLDSGSALVVVETASNRIIGSARYYDWDPARREVAIGYTFLARAYWGGATNGELKRLMIGHAARWAERVWFHVGKHNLRSQRAMEKIGAKVECEALRPLNGEMIPFLYYRIDTAGW